MRLSDNPEKVLELLIAERNRHFDHPSAITAKAFFAFSVVMTGLLAGILLRKTDAGPPVPFLILILGIFPILVGFALLVWGIVEHQEHHRRRRQRLERLIHRLMSTNLDAKAVDSVLKDTTNPDSEIGVGQYAKGSPPEDLEWLFLAEPDQRSLPFHHDTKIFFGLLTCFLGPIAWLLGSYCS